jgi:hypothetical protein
MLLQSSAFCTPVPLPSLAFQLLTIGQSILSTLCIFVASPALRHHFKIR